jgi:hypothetical protein
MTPSTPHPAAPPRPGGDIGLVTDRWALATALANARRPLVLHAAHARGAIELVAALDCKVLLVDGLAVDVLAVARVTDAAVILVAPPLDGRCREKQVGLLESVRVVVYIEEP